MEVVAQAIEHMPSKQKALSSNSSITKKKAWVQIPVSPKRKKQRKKKLLRLSKYNLSQTG
jgi:hypothetical protein